MLWIFSDYLMAHVYDESEVMEYVGSFTWLLGGETISTTNQQEFDAEMAASATYGVDFIPNDVGYRQGQDDWLVF